jgi:NitT/TauT family transport system ATP-binding protein
MNKNLLLEAKQVSISFPMPNHGAILVADEINFSLHEGEFVAILGSSGSGKSSFLRCLSGLIPPSKGTVQYRDKPMQGANPNVSMVFQSAALFPWLNVLDNVSVGLKAKGVPPDEIEKRALSGIDLVGLDGFETAYPKELSGGMRQRAGFARALVVEPEILFLDEPFSGLDILTAENLRTDLLDLWIEKKIPTKAMVLVTHSIEEAILLADRIIIFSKNPGRIKEEIVNTIPHYRDREDPEFLKLSDYIYSVMMGRKVSKTGKPAKVEQKMLVPIVGEESLSGFIEHIYELEERADIYKVAQDLQMDVDRIQPLIEAGEWIGLLETKEGDLFTTQHGKLFAEADVLEKKEIYRRLILEKVPFILKLINMINEQPSKRIDYNELMDSLVGQFSEERAEEQLDAAIDIGRYSELFGYDENKKEFFIEQPES